VTEPRCIHLIGAGGGRICFLHTVRGEVLASGDAKVRKGAVAVVVPALGGGRLHYTPPTPAP
jgi:hypothetical protein